MSEKILVEIIVLIKGNFIPIQLEAGEVIEFKKELEKAINSSGEFNGSTWFRWKNYINIDGSKIDGYYLRKYQESVPEKMLKQIKKMTDNNGPGEEWKNSDNE